MKHVSDPFVTLESTIDYLRHSRHTWTVFSFPFRMLPWFEYPLDLCLLLWLLIPDSIWMHNSFLPSFSVPNHPSPLPSFPLLLGMAWREMILFTSRASSPIWPMIDCAKWRDHFLRSHPPPMSSHLVCSVFWVSVHLFSIRRFSIYFLCRELLSFPTGARCLSAFLDSQYFRPLLFSRGF